MQYDRSSPTYCPEMLNTGHCRHRDCQYHSENHPTAPLPSQPNQNCTAPPMRRIEFDQKWTERSMMIRDNYNQGCDMQRSNGDYMPPNPSQQHHSQQLVDDFGPMKRSSSSERYEPFKRFRGDTDSINSSPDMIGILRRFEEEISQLRRRVEANEVKVAELRASNDYLMSQNAQLRLSNAQQCSAVVNPVTVTTSQPQATVSAHQHYGYDIFLTLFITSASNKRRVHGSSSNRSSAGYTHCQYVGSNSNHSQQFMYTVSDCCHIARSAIGTVNSTRNEYAQYVVSTNERVTNPGNISDHINSHASHRLFSLFKIDTMCRTSNVMY